MTIDDNKGLPAGASALSAKPLSEAPKADPGAFVKPTLARIVHLYIPGDGYDGQNMLAGIVSRVNEDGSINVQAFAGGGGSNLHMNGVRHEGDIAGLPDGDAGKNLPYWLWPPRA